MRPLQSVQRRTGFETLEAKKLFAADLMGGAAIDLPDTAIVDGVVSQSPVAGSLSPASIGWVNANLGGQEGEDVTGDAATIVGGLVAEFGPGELASVQMNPGDAAVEFSARVFDGTGGFSFAETLWR